MMVNRSSATEDRVVSVKRSVWAAAAWAFVFTAMSVYWALGGTLGVETLGDAFMDPAILNDPAFVAFVWLTAVLKLLLGLLALALIQPWAARFPLRLRFAAAWMTGLLLTLYGIALMIQHGFMAAGISAVPASIGSLASVRWHLFLWDPFWLVGGLLFLNAAYRVTRDHTKR